MRSRRRGSAHERAEHRDDDRDRHEPGDHPVHELDPAVRADLRAPGARFPLVQFGQSGQPSPEPVSRTAAPGDDDETEQDRRDER